MRNNLTFLFIIMPFLYFSQDGIAPLTANPDLFGKQQRMELKSMEDNTIDSTVIYLPDTLTLPFFDDFSRDKFQEYKVEPGATGLAEKVYYKLLDKDTETPLPAGTKLTDQATYKSIYNPDLDTTILEHFDTLHLLYSDLKSYPPDYQNVTGFVPYVIFDTLGSFHPEDTVYIDEIVFEQDSARVFITQINDPEKLWLNRQAYHNYRFAKEPWSLGVVTFDGLDEYGYPYNFNSATNAMCDTLKAKPIDLSGHSPADSVYFSFLYQREGFGDNPEESDSLYVEFYSPVTEMWKRVWAVSGGEMEDFQVAHMALKDPDYFENGFQFRFMNYGAVAGALDHFHIDYVHLRAQSGYQDTLFKDFAVVYPISTLLKDYTSVPWKHYQNHPNGKMSDSVMVTVRNGSELTENNQSGKVNVYFENQLEGAYTLDAATLSGGDINYAPRTTYSSYHDFSTGYAFDPSLGNDTMAVFEYEGIATAQFPNEPINDTTFGKQVFKNYYAYDDGTAEKAYGVTGEQALLAHQFKAYQPDSLIAIQIHFVPSVVDVSNNLFLLSVWDDDNGQPGDTLYEDKFYFPRQPKYEKGRNEFTTYFFPDTMKIGVGETFYVGMRQIDEERLNIGLDMNHDHADKIFWSVNAGMSWNNANYPGALMIRPVISSKMDAYLGVETEEIIEQEYDFSVYPNPATSTVHIAFDTENIHTSFEILDLNGRLVKQIKDTATIDVSSIERGIYLVVRKEQGQPVKTKKLVIQ